MIDWFKYYKHIPSSVKIGKNVYEVHWIDEFPKDKKQLGESRFDEEEKEIIIKIGQSNKECVHTYWHELCHVASEEYDIELTEKQVLNLELFLKDLLKPNNIWKKEVKKNASDKRKRKNFRNLR